MTHRILWDETDSRRVFPTAEEGTVVGVGILKRAQGAALLFDERNSFESVNKHDVLT